jgi:hypothetical protein
MQCCGAVIISFGSVEPLIRITALAPDPVHTRTYVVFTQKYLLLLSTKYKFPHSKSLIKYCSKDPEL